MASENAITTPETALTGAGALDAGAPLSVPPHPPGTPDLSRGEGSDPAGPLLVGFLLLLAILTALVPIRNSDFFQHLALGRAVTQGNLPLGTDPLTAPGEAVTWAQHSWIFDVLLLVLFSIGGALLVLAVKASLVVVLVLRQWAVAHVPHSRASSVVLCLLLGLVVLSPYLLVQSRLVSLVMLSVTVAVLARYHIAAEKFPPIWALPVICFAWGNLDSWFFLGPVCVGLYFAGLMLDVFMQPAPPEGTPPARVDAPLPLIFGLCVLAGCLNPGLFALGWSLPPELGLNGCLVSVGDLPGYKHLSASPLSSDYHLPTTGWSVAGQGYLVLLLLTLASFPLLGRRMSWAGLLLVLGLAGLSLYRVAAIPFFAVAAAPWLARNVQILLAISSQQAAAKKSDATSGALLTGLFLVLAGVGTYAGWLNAWPWTSSRFGLTLETNGGLKEMAERVQSLATWYREQTDENAPVWFNTSPEAAHYIAWFAPGQRTYIDQRLALSTTAAADYRGALASLFERFRDAQDSYEILRQRGVRFVVFHQAHLLDALQATNKLRPDAPVEQLVRDVPLCLPLFQIGQLAPDWPVLDVRGATGLFGFSDPNEPKWKGFFDEQRLQLNGLAFGEHPLRAPATRPDQEAEPVNWLTTLWNPQPLRNLEAEEAAQFWFLYESSILPQARKTAAGWEAIRVSAILGFAADLPSIASAPFAALQMRLLNGNPPTPLAAPFFNDANRGDPSALYTTLRAARQSLHANPFDAEVQLRLAQCYYSLSHNTRESGRSRTFPHLNQLRRYQIIAAAQAAVRLNPELQGAHNILARTYQELGALDLVLEHYREEIRINVAEGPMPGESPQEAEARWQASNQQLIALEKEVANRSKQLTIQTATKKALQKAAGAIWPGPDGQSPGLIREGLSILRGLSPEELTESAPGQQPIGPRLYIEALFLVGDLAQIRATLEDADPRLFGMHPFLGIPAIDWYRFCLAASSGDYEKGNQTLQDLLEVVAQDSTTEKNREMAAHVLTESITILAGIGRMQLSPLTLVMQGPHERFVVAIQLAAASLENPQMECILRTLQGGLLMEWGDNEAARTILQRAIDEAKKAGIGFSGQQIAQLNLELLRSGKKSSKVP